MSESNNPAEPTENQGGGTTSKTTTDSTIAVDEPDAVAAEPTENQGGGSD
jgi:hypothetical protein